MNPLHPAISLRAGKRCEYCHAPESVSNFFFEVEHILPESAGGTSDADNLALACRACNAYKGARQSAIDPATNRRVSLFHPRRDRWSDHFSVDLQTDVIVGLTEIGRATVIALQMNHPVQVEARPFWKRLLLFP